MGRPEGKGHGHDGHSRRQSKRGGGKDSQASLTYMFKEQQKKDERRQSKALDTLYEGSVRNLDLEAEQVSIYTESPEKKESPDTPVQSVEVKPQRRRPSRLTAQQDKALRISALVEEMNKGRSGVIKQRLRTFDDVVRAALTKRVQSGTTDTTDSSSLSSIIIS